MDLLHKIIQRWCFLAVVLVNCINSQVSGLQCGHVSSVLSSYLGDTDASLEDFPSFFQITWVSKRVVGPDFDLSISDGDLSVSAVYQPSDFNFGLVPNRLAIVRIYSSTGHASTGDLVIVI